MEHHLETDFFDFQNLSESVDLEFKAAQGRGGQGDVPKSVWETYSAMANSQGGTIILGVSQEDDKLRAIGITDPDRVIQDFWNQINNPQVVSANILTDGRVRIQPHYALKLIFIQVPVATRRNRPVFVGTNPLVGTYRRNNEGDYRCSEEVVRQMLGEHPRELTQVLHTLVERGLLESEGKGKATFYFLPGEHPIQTTGTEEVFNFKAPPKTPIQASESSDHSADNSDYLAADSDYKVSRSDSADLSREDWDQLMRIAAPIRLTGRATSERVREVLLRLLQDRFLTLNQLSEFLGRQNDGLRNNYINPMLGEGLLEAEFANIKNHPKQRYQAAPEAPASS